MKTTTPNNTEVVESLPAPGSDNGAAEILPDDEIAYEKATKEVLSDLSDKKKREQSQKYFGDRPKHLRKSLAEMTANEKAEYYRWRAGEFAPKEKAEAKIEEEQKKPVRYTDTMVRRTGKMILRFFARRMPVSKEVSGEELDSFTEVFTPLANKYLGGVGEYNEELAGAVFLMAFFGERLKSNDATAQ